MQFINSNPYNSSGSERKGKQKIVLAIVLLFVLSFVLYLSFFAPNKESVDPGDTGVYHDPYSGETVSDPEGWQSENFANQARAPIFLGFSKLLDIGITQFQLDATKAGFTEYSNTKDNYVNEVSIHTNSIKREPYDPNMSEPTRRVFFTVTINRTEALQATIEYTSIRSATLVLRKNDSLVFTSTPADLDDTGHEHPGMNILEPEYPR